MYLKRLELCGFKSFADRTKLDFEPGITAIIGPNGCGKSNTSDAIRWCLGEQSARSMRSQQMLDVVFSGSQSRPTTGMAEVTLTFDNSQNMLPIDYSEIAVTRRLFRSGESEYFLNKVQCRLKDIRDLFLDTGIGTEGYAIIEQGKVEFILSAKPEQKREMFEEAAGVSKYKVRREETLRKLEKVEIDMNRLGDMLALIKEQIGALDAAARKARQFKKISEDLRRMEITSLVHHILAAQKEIERIGALLEPKSLEFEKLNTSLNQIEADIADLRVTQVEKDDLYVKLQDEYSQIRSGINLADERVQQSARRETELKERRTALSSSIEAGGLKFAQFETELAQIHALAETLKGRVAELEQEYKNKEATINAVRSAGEELKGHESSLRTRQFDLATEKATLHNEQNRLTSRQAHCQAQVQSLQKELNRLKEQHGPLTGEIGRKGQEVEAVRKSAAELAVRIEDFRNQIRDLDARRTEVQSRQATLRERMVANDSRRQMLAEWEQKDPLRTALRAVQSLDIAGIRGPVSGHIRIDPGMEDVVAAALGDRLNYLVCDTVDAAQAAIRHLEENNLGRLTFVVLDRLPESVPQATVATPVGARPLVSLIQFAPEMSALMRFLCGETLVNGQTIYGRAILQGGSKITFDQPVLVEEQIRRLHAEHEGFERDLANAGTELTGMNERLAKLQEEKSDLDLSLQKATVEADWATKHIGTLREELEYLDKEIGLILAEIQSQENEEKSIKEQTASREARLLSIDEEERSVKEKLEFLAGDITRNRDEENRLAPLLTEAKVAWATQQNELAGREREEQKLTESLAGLRQQTDEHRQELAAIETKIVEMVTLQETESARLKVLHREQAQKEAEVQLALTQRQDIAKQMETKNAALHELRTSLEELKSEIHNLQIEQRSHELQKQATDQRLSQDFSLAFADVKDEHAALTYSDEEISRLRRRIESMGAVNLAAPEEYANLEERYNFLLTQQQDLIKAKEDLHQVITKINHNTKEHFRKTFDLVRENFRTLYRRLFEGGEADLILTDESNLLECGVEIYAQPPGKKLQNIALLSGGEKALTAISLLFAFFMVKPSPFCILDEVDAPLDDANIGRFINLVKSFAEKSQFLMITHNKRTMEMANVLYGVTMEELGVSKIISVKMSKEEDLAATA